MNIFVHIQRQNIASFNNCQSEKTSWITGLIEGIIQKTMRKLYAAALYGKCLFENLGDTKIAIRLFSDRHSSGKPVSVCLTRSGFRQSHAGLPHVFAITVFIGGFAYFVAFEEQYLCDTLARINLSR